VIQTDGQGADLRRAVSADRISTLRMSCARSADRR